jgi:hypothetical protein
MRTSSAVLALILLAGPALAHELPLVQHVELQPLAAQANRIADALDFLGTPLSAAERASLRRAGQSKDEAADVLAIQKVLDPHCLAGVRLASKEKMEVLAGPAAPRLAEQGWRVFLVKVDNAAGIDNLELRADSPSALPLYRPSSGKPDPTVVSVGEVGKRFLELTMFNQQPLLPHLSGLELEYRIVQVYSRDAGRREARLGFGLWTDRDPAHYHGQLAGHSQNQITLLCESIPAVLVRLAVHDVDGKPTMASFVFRDSQGHVYPALSRRLAPDFGFHPQIYRRDGETVLLQPGAYTVTWTRGPEYRELQRTITVPPVPEHREQFQLERWIHPAEHGWYSGDHHVHAAGCSHYESPAEGVTPEDMFRHILGEDLDVGCCLSWGPCWYFQKRYFEGKVNALSTAEHLLRYDVEVSGFPSSHCGHLCLLRLKQQDYPGTKRIEDWPSWDLPILRWAKSQGAVVGFAHSGWGLEVGPTRKLPNYIVPPMSGIGANEYLVDIAHGMCDFMSTVDTPAVWELNIWYHSLNCGYRARISGETDFPCIYGERVGLGRSYVHLDGKLDFDAWTEGIKQGRSYVSDGRSHLLDFRVNNTAVGTSNSEVHLTKPGTVTVHARVAALLDAQLTAATEHVRKTPLDQKPYWDLERARIGSTRTVPLEVIVNGQVVATKKITADGERRDVSFDVPIKQSSWVCVRIFPSSHTNPVFVLVGDKPIRASKRSADWCLKAIDRCWEQKRPNIRPSERPAAKQAYDEARAAYRKILAECETE